MGRRPFLFFRALNFGRKQRNFWQPLALVVLYGLFDEIHLGQAVTMYGYSDYEETQKRTLEPPDIKGLLTLYP